MPLYDQPPAEVPLSDLPLSVSNGGTGSATAGAALTALGAAPLASPAITGAVYFLRAFAV